MNVWTHMLYICIIVIVTTFAYETNVKQPEEVKVESVEKRCIVSKYKPHSFESAVKRTD